MATTIVTETETGIPDAELVGSVLVGDTSAFGRLYDRYAGLIRAICYDATGELAAGQDLAQEVFLLAYQKLASLRDPERFPAWLVGIARHCCRQWRRQMARDRRVLEGLAAAGSRAALPAAGEDEGRELRQAMMLLPDKQRLAMHAFYLLDQSADEARSVMGLSRSGFYKLLQRAKDSLRRRMNEDGRCSHE